MKELSTDQLSMVSGGLGVMDTQLLSGGQYVGRIRGGGSSSGAVDVDRNGSFTDAIDGTGNVRDGRLFMDDGRIFDDFEVQTTYRPDTIRFTWDLTPPPGSNWDQAVHNFDFRLGEVGGDIGDVVSDAPSIFGDVFDVVTQNIVNWFLSDFTNSYSDMYEIQETTTYRNGEMVVLPGN